MIVLQVLGWVLFTIVLVVVVLLLWPVAVLVQYQEGVLTARLRILLFTFRLYSSAPKTVKPDGNETQQAKKKPKKAPKKSKQNRDKPSEQPAAQEEKTPPQQKEKRKLTFDDILTIVPTAGAGMRRIIRGIRITKIKLFLPVYTEDAAETAIRYGRIQAYVGGALGVLHNAMHLRFRQMRIVPDFNNEFSDKTYFYCKIWAAPIIMVAALVYVLIRLKNDAVL